ncbi:MAG: iron-containing alcohol dehydrogenase [Bacillota bacterium]|jgi:alcohol dehydrogenase class IV
MNYASLKESIPNGLKDVAVFQTAGTKPLGKVAIGFGLAEKIGEEAAKFGQGKVILVTDKNIVNLGLHLIVVNSLEQAGFEVTIFDEVEAEPHIETAQKIQEIVRQEKYALVVGLGGGSPMDMAKTTAIAATNPADISEYIQGAPITNDVLPCILVPTTSGTGSEVSPFVVTSKGDKKLFISSPYCYPTIALVDPLMTATMPPRVTAATGLDALSHGVEGFIGKPSPFSDAFTSKCVQYVFQYLQRACADGNDLEARYYMSFASVFGMMSYTQGGGLYAHSCSYILTIGKGLPHGIGCGVALPYTLAYNYDYIKDILLRFAPLIDPAIQGSDDQVAMKVIEKFYDLLGKVNIPNNLKDLGVEENEIPAMADDLVKKYYRVRNPRAMSEEESLKFMECMWQGKLERI